MLSKEMYTVLSCFPQKLGNSIKYEVLLAKCSLSKDDINECLNETLFPAWNYVRSSDGWKNGSQLFLTESGLSKIEEYEDALLNQKISKRTLKVSIITLAIAIVSLAVAIISIFK